MKPSSMNKFREMQQSLANYKEMVQKLELEKRVLQAQMAEYLKTQERDTFRLRAYLHLKDVGVLVMDKEGDRKSTRLNSSHT